MPRSPVSLWDAETGRRIRVARLAANFTQQAVADKLDCTFQAVQKLEKGTTKLSAHTAIVLADLFNIDVRHLLGVTP